MTEEELNALIGESRLPDDYGDLFSAEKATTPKKAFTNLEYRENRKTILNLLRQMSDDARYASTRDTLPLDMMEQRFIDPRDYGAASPPNAPQISKEQSDRLNPHPTVMRWLDQLINRLKNPNEPPPQLTGRFRDRMAL
jgi:hypothetical protein